MSMSNVQRTPPKVNKNLTLTQSEPDISSAIMTSDFVTSRSKRSKPEFSLQSGPDQECQDLQDILFTWKQEQDARVSNMLSEQKILMTKLLADISEIKIQNSKIQESNSVICKSNADIERSIHFMNQAFEDLKKEVEDLKRECQEKRCYIDKLEKKITDLQFRSRSSGIEIRNIPCSDTENTASLLKTVCSIGDVVGLPIPESDVRDVYRIPGKPNQSTAPRPIIAEFNTVHTKHKMLTAVRSYNANRKSKDDKLNTKQIGLPGKNQPVYVAEQLPASTKKLFHQAREFAKNYKYTFCWTSNGNIFLRKQVGDKQVLVQSEKSLEDLKNINM